MSRQLKHTEVASYERQRIAKIITLRRELRAKGKRLSRRSEHILAEMAGRGRG